MATETRSTRDEIECPHCGHSIKNLCDYELDGDEGTDAECCECEGKFRLSAHDTRTYTAKALWSPP